MTDGKQEPGQLIDIGTIAAHNIANAVGLGEEHILTIRNAIRDEVSAMSSHFTLAMADVETHYEIEVNKAKTKFAADVADIKSTFNYVKANAVKIAVAAAVLVGAGALVGHFV